MVFSEQSFKKILFIIANTFYSVISNNNDNKENEQEEMPIIKVTLYKERPHSNAFEDNKSVPGRYVHSHENDV